MGVTSSRPVATFWLTIPAANTVALVNVLTDPKGRRSGAAYLG